jgi:hypothetical protein
MNNTINVFEGEANFTMTNPVGRPSKYDPAYCNQVIELGKQGKSFEQMASIIGVGITSFKRWREEHEEFRTSLEDAQGFAQTWWEDMAQSYLVESKDTEKLNTGLWSRSMAARFPANYSDRVKQEISGPGGAPLKTGFVLTFEEPSNGNDSTSEG